MYDRSRFGRFSKWISRIVGRPITFGLALLVVLVWALSGPLFGFSNTWQLLINTATTTVTFLMVFLIQHTQSRDAAAIQLKLDELIRSQQGAHMALLDIEELEEHELERLRDRYEALARSARERLRQNAAGADAGDTLFPQG